MARVDDTEFYKVVYVEYVPDLIVSTDECYVRLEIDTDLYPETALDAREVRKLRKALKKALRHLEGR